jgi:hypothetical protein
MAAITGFPSCRPIRTNRNYATLSGTKTKALTRRIVRASTDEKDENLSVVAGTLCAAGIASFLWLVLILIIRFF